MRHFASKKKILRSSNDRLKSETFCIQEENLKIFKRSSQEQNHLIRCLGFCNRPSRPLTHLSFCERGEICFLFQSKWCQQENICFIFVAFTFHFYSLFSWICVNIFMFQIQCTCLQKQITILPSNNRYCSIHVNHIIMLLLFVPHASESMYIIVELHLY